MGHYQHPFVLHGIDAVRETAKFIMRYLGRSDRMDLIEKDDHSYTTQVDQQAEVLLIESILQRFPKHIIIGEETGTHTPNQPDQIKWIIDPIDGTMNFIHGLPYFCISIAIAYQDEIEHAIIYDPMRNELWTASKGQGLQLDQKRIRMRTPKSPKLLMSCNLPCRQTEPLNHYTQQLKQLQPELGSIRHLGSVGLELAYTASNRLQAVQHYGLKPWDKDAGLLMIKEAGGDILHIPAQKDRPSGFIAGQPDVVNRIKARLSIENA
jgi:myo-inositol-1(or 4)-monophosphatase